VTYKRLVGAAPGRSPRGRVQGRGAPRAREEQVGRNRYTLADRDAREVHRASRTERDGRSGETGKEGGAEKVAAPIGPSSCPHWPIQ